MFETARLTLRPLTPADFEESATTWADPEVTRYVGGRPLTREEAWARVLRGAGHWALVGYGSFVAREKGSGRYVGEFGACNLKREMAPPLGDQPEVGWVLARWAHGKGYATEATLGLLAWLEESRGPEATVCIIDAANAPSLRVAEKCGYERAGEAMYKGAPILVLRRAASARGGSL